jgi:hypothetical protein
MVASLAMVKLRFDLCRDPAVVLAVGSAAADHAAQDQTRSCPPHPRLRDERDPKRSTLTVVPRQVSATA